MAAHVINSNRSRIIDSNMNIQVLATKLMESHIITRDINNMVFDEFSGMSRYHRYVKLVDNMEKGVKHNGELFTTLLQIFRECGKVPLSDELQQHYSKLYTQSLLY